MEKRYQHITVEPHAEEDVVIQAGVARTSARSPRTSDGFLPSTAESHSETCIATHTDAHVNGDGADAALGGAPTVSGGPEASAAHDAHDARVLQQRTEHAGAALEEDVDDFAARTPRAGQEPCTGYRATTLADLERQPMPRMQKAIIGTALIALVGAIVYVLLFMG